MYSEFSRVIANGDKPNYLQHFLIVACIYAISLPLVGIAYAIDLIDAQPALIAASFAVIFNVTLAMVFVTNRNGRFADPALVSFQTIVAIAYSMFLAYSFNHDRSLPLFMCFVALLFGVFKFNTREFVFNTLLMLASYALVINLLMQYKPKTVNVYLEWYQWLTLAMILPAFALIGGRISEMRMHMAKSNTALRTALTKIQSMAHIDSLTGLANRVALDDKLKKAVVRSKSIQRHAAVLFIDLDHFKQINDSLGHPLGDSVLREITRRLSFHVTEHDTLGRLGGDEFVLLLENLDNTEQARTIAEKLLASLSPKMRLDGHDVALSASIGIAICPEHGETAEALISNADIAMYAAKSAGRAQVRMFSAQLSEIAIEKFTLDADLRQAIAREEFVLYFQPKMDINTNTAVGVEALIRWQHPRLGLLYPNSFIGFAEERGHIIAIGRWVLRTALEKLKKWELAGLPSMTMSVNLSSIQLLQPGFVEDCAQILKASKVNTKMVELEITESVLMQNPLRAAEVLADLGALGFKLAIDDFGTGYSSLAYLKQFPVHTLKVDQSFVRDLPHNCDDVAITRAVIAMAHSLRMNVVAEGVERLEQLDLLRAEGCNEFQGFYCAKALPEAELIQFYKALGTRQ